MNFKHGSCAWVQNIMDTKRAKAAEVTFVLRSFGSSRLDHERNTDTRKKRQTFQLLSVKMKTTKWAGAHTQNGDKTVPDQELRCR
jgi:hypothetical protein